MATINITSTASQNEVPIPERGMVDSVTVNGAKWAFRQSGPDDLSIDLAPALAAGMSVTITYTPMPRTAVDLEGVNATLATKADKSELAALSSRVDSIPAGGGGGGIAAPTVTPFAQSIKFDKLRTMGEQAVTFPLTFTVDANGAVDDAETTLALIANGTDDVLWDPVFNLTGAQAYDNTDGRINLVSMWRSFGRYYYGVTLGPIIDLKKPELISAAVDVANPNRLVLTWDEAMSSTISDPDAFGITGKTATAHTRLSATQTYLTVSANFTFGQTGSVTYTKPTSKRMKDLAGNEANTATVAFTNALTAPSTLNASNTKTTGANAVNLTTGAGLPWVPDDWQMFRGDSNGPFYKAKNPGAFDFVGVGLITGPTWTNRDSANGFGVDNGQNVDWTNNDEAAGGNNHPTPFARQFPALDASQPQYEEWDLPASNTQQNTVVIGWNLRRYEYGNVITPVGYKFTFTLSDGSKAPLTHIASATVGDYGYIAGEVTANFMAASPGATLRVKVEPLSSMVNVGGWMGVGAQYVAFKKNT